MIHESAVVLADAVGPHAVTVGEARAACSGFGALLFATESGGLPSAARIDGAGSSGLVSDGAFLFAGVHGG